MKAVLIMLCSLLPMTLAAQAPNTLTQAEIQQGWKLLWDGKTGAGWHTASGEAIPNESWTIADGVLLDHANGGHGHGHSGDLLTDGDYRNFELSVDFKLASGANSGIKYFVNTDRANGGDPTIGLEYQLLDDDRHPDAKLGRDGNRTEASLYDLVPAAKNKPYRPIGEWNTARIVSRGPHTEHWWHCCINFSAYEQLWYLLGFTPTTCTHRARFRVNATVPSTLPGRHSVRRMESRV